MNIYNSLVDCFIPGDFPIFIGKDKAALGVLFDIYGITDPIEKEFVLHIINIFDAKAVDAARKRASISRKTVEYLTLSHMQISARKFPQWAFHDEAWLWVICPELFIGKNKL